MYIATYDVQNVDVTVKEDFIIVTCQFAGGSPVHGFKAEILNKRKVLLSRFVSLGEQCTQNRFSLCSVSTSFRESNLELEGCNNITINVYDWETDGNITRVFSQDFVVTTAHPNVSHVTKMPDAVVDIIHVNWGRYNIISMNE